MTNKYLPYQLIFLYLIKKRIELKKKDLLVKNNINLKIPKIFIYFI